jgi:hypothetical protein
MCVLFVVCVCVCIISVNKCISVGRQPVAPTCRSNAVTRRDERVKLLKNYLFFKTAVTDVTDVTDITDVTDVTDVSYTFHLCAVRSRPRLPPDTAPSTRPRLSYVGYGLRLLLCLYLYTIHYTLYTIHCIYPLLTYHRRHVQAGLRGMDR